MGLTACCSLPGRRKRRQRISPRGRPRHPRPVSPLPDKTSLLPSALPPLEVSPFRPPPFRLSSSAPSPSSSPERRVASCSPAFRRPSSTLVLSPRYLARDTSRFSSFETAPLGRSSPSPGYSHQEIALVARDVWEQAYDQVRGDEALKPLVKNYEELFNNIAGTGGGLLGSRRSSRAQREPMSDDEEHSNSGEESCFTRLAQEYLELARRDSGHQGVVSSAVHFIQKTKDAVGLALASSPPASLAWTGICTIILPIIVNHAEQIAAREAGFSYVMSRFTWYGQVLDLLNRAYWKSPHSFCALRQVIYDEIVALYKLLIEYQLRAYYTYCRPFTTISRDILKLDDWNCMIAEIKESEKHLEDYMSLNYEQHLLDKLHTLSEDALHKQRVETLLKFKFPEDLPYAVYQAYLDSIDSPQDGTGAGVLTHHAFVKWAAGESGVFVLEGIPGSGKSVLSKSLLTELPKWRDTTVCAFFFKDNGKGQNAATTALCRVLDELFRGQPSLVDGISAKIGHLLPEEVRCNFDLLWSILEETAASCGPGSITVVLDGFDECEPDSADKLCRKIAEYLAGPDPRVKFFLTTRPLVSAPQMIDAPDVVVLKLEEDPHCRKYISKDIESVVIARFDGFALKCIQDATLRQELLEMVRPKEDRTYLYVKLLFDYLELRMRDGVPRVSRGWIGIFKTLPTTVKEAYLGFLTRVRESQQEDVRRLFQIVVAAARPLTLREVNIALNIRDLPNGSMHGLGLQNEACFRTWILDACKYFLDVYNGRVYFIHQTAKDFLLAGPQDGGQAKPQWLGDFNIQTCHMTLAESCILYLSLPLRIPSRFEGSNFDAKDMSDYHLWHADELAFASYAHLFWHSHVSGAVSVDQPSNEVFLFGIMKTLRPWYQKMTTSGLLPRVPRVSTTMPGSFERLATVLKSLATYQAVQSLTTYRLHSPIPAEWFSVRLFNKARRSHDTSSSGPLQVCHGEALSYAISNRSDIYPVYVHMLSLNASWTIGIMLWNVRIPPRQQRTGHLTMTLPRRVNNDDPQEADDTILVIFCVGEQCAERMVSPSEWLSSVYVPPVLVEPGKKTVEVPIYPFFAPPPNWLVKDFRVRTVPRSRPQGGLEREVAGQPYSDNGQPTI
ncbi:hypothetical protein N657DRAFT_625707 [Parathielavia appendiculata]|uniref:NACHT domain-containing protein n=1 Tax=Parathielavia appendiculata TaxID=2587402 RepID=A0AAN6TSV8_9PEZI|nr:hypothetical protein N657DRAFT_625707 [Parathielavia appendiculata]